jgi:hypothetical protein
MVRRNTLWPAASDDFIYSSLKTPQPISEPGRNSRTLIELHQGGGEYTPIQWRKGQLVAVREIRRGTISRAEINEIVKRCSKCELIVSIRDFHIDGENLYIYHELIDTTLHSMFAVLVPFSTLQIAVICKEVSIGP